MNDACERIPVHSGVQAACSSYAAFLDLRCAKGATEQSSDDQKGNIEPSRVIPANAFLSDLDRVFVWSEIQKTKDELDCQPLRSVWTS
jgi:hypothetical protein